jgi:DNA-directed RNA polymerase specialized sigma24 family protein
MIDEQFKQESDQILKDRMAKFKFWSSIVPAANRERRKDLSWYINKRNRPTISEFQNVHEMDVESAPYASYGEWLGEQKTSEGFEDGRTKEPILANPDNLDETTNIYPTVVEYSEAQLTAATSILKRIESLLTANELNVWKLKEQGLGVGEIADVRGVSPAAISKTLARITRKLKAVYDQICPEKD